MANAEIDKLVGLLEEFLVIYKTVNRKTIADILKAELINQQLIEIYQLTNGERSSREIASLLKSKCAHTTIFRTWNKWAQAGIVVPSKQKGRYKAAFDLLEYGISEFDDNE